MRAAASFIVGLVLIALAPLAAQAQRPDSTTLGIWTGRAQLNAPFTRTRELNIRLDIREDGAVFGAIGDAQLVEASLYRDSRVAIVLGLARQFVVHGRLTGALIRAEGIVRDRVYLSLDRDGSRLVGSLQTSGGYEGGTNERMLTGTVALERAAPTVASHPPASTEEVRQSGAASRPLSP